MQYIKQLCKLVFSYAKVEFFLVISQKLIEAILPCVNVFVLSELVNQTIKVAEGKGEVKNVVILLLLLLCIETVNRVSKEINNYFKNKTISAIREHFTVDLLNKTSRLKYEYFEDANTRDLMERVFDKAEEKVVNGFYNLVSLISSILRTVGIAIIVFTQNWCAGLGIVLLDIPIILLSIKNGTTTYAANQEATRYRRSYQYLEELMLSRDNVNERKIYNSFSTLSQKWNQQYEITRKLEMSAFLKYFLPIRLSAFAEIVSVVLIMCLLALPVEGRTISAGLYMAVTGNIIQLFRIQTAQLPFGISEVVKSIRYQKELEIFLNFDEVLGNSMPKETGKSEVMIECKNLSFSYPNTTRRVLDGVNLKIEPWKNYAFVGANGSGKSTLIKLLLGVYTDYEGSILINRREVRTYTCEELHRIFSVVFQDYARYGISIRDNILIGNIDKLQSGEDIENILKRLRLWEKVNSLEKKEDTYLGKIRVDSTDFSIGQWQKIAIGRSLVSSAPIKILDEPTAALDPNLEYEFYQKYEEMREGSGTILISHRLASVQKADKIFVLHEGKIEEEGTHEELMEIRGIYYEMYTKQKAWYDKTPSTTLVYGI